MVVWDPGSGKTTYSGSRMFGMSYEAQYKMRFTIKVRWLGDHSK
jgi:hypothetical protein